MAVDIQTDIQIGDENETVDLSMKQDLNNLSKLITELIDKQE